MQSLFEWDFNSSTDKKPDLEEILKRDVEEFAPGASDISFMEDLLKNIVAKQAILDEIIEKAAPEWPIARISIVDRNVLRIGLYELLFGDRAEVPPKVAINEAIELAKSFGGENSGKFVNGVLGAVYKELGEPGKDDVSKKKNNNPIDISKLPVERLGGAIVYAKHDNQFHLAFVHDIFGHWTLSKGHIEENEDEREATTREIKEELGIDIDIKEKIGENEYLASKPEKGKIRKHVSYFLAEAKYGPLKLEEEKGGLDDCKWFPITEVPNLNIYDDILPIITKAITILMDNK